VAVTCPVALHAGSVQGGTATADHATLTKNGVTEIGVEWKGVTAADLERAGVRIVVESGSCRVALGDGITSYSLYGDANKPADCVPIIAVHVYDRQEDHFGNEYWTERAPQCSPPSIFTYTAPADSSMVVTNP
jgi:hypothetical protein